VFFNTLLTPANLVGVNSSPPSGGSDLQDLSEHQQVRRAKRQAILDRGEEAYPAAVPIDSSIAAVRAAHGGLEPGTYTGEIVGLAGRVMYLRNTGKLCFATLQDGAGLRLQAMISLAEVGAESLASYKAEVDLGDHLFVHGQVITSKRGELSVLADRWTMAAKALRPLPVLHSELSDESRIRDRTADLIVRQAARDIARQRSQLVRSVRGTMHGLGYDEIETPVLQTVHGGALARPFTTHINAYGIDLYLRIATELFLKRAMIGGLDKVFEVGKIFRNEGADSTHAPEFTSIEVYEAYGDYDTMATLTRQIVQDAAVAVTGSTTVTWSTDGRVIDLGGEQWRQISFFGSLSQALGESIGPDTSREELAKKAQRLEVEVSPAAGSGQLAEALFEHLLGDQLDQPTFVRDFPIDTSPLTRAHRSTPGVAEKWDLYIGGLELATAYSELVDPVIQRQRFEAQAALAAAGDPEAMRLDQDFLDAMEYGMPPAGGMGMGIDRLMMVLTGLGIRETTLFPIVKPLN